MTVSRIEHLLDVQVRYTFVQSVNVGWREVQKIYVIFTVKLILKAMNIFSSAYGCSETHKLYTNLVNHKRNER